MKDADKLRDTSRRILGDAFASAALIASVGEALHAAGDLDGSRRAFEEIIERSPRDPWARAFAGDRLRALDEDDKTAAIYASLEVTCRRLLEICALPISSFSTRTASTSFQLRLRRSRSALRRPALPEHRGGIVGTHIDAADTRPHAARRCSRAG